jgi:SAM-dependent methyltransferase
MLVVKNFYDKDTKETIEYSPEIRMEAILDDWKTKKDKDQSLNRYQIYLKRLTPDTKDKVVIEIGCGAFGGVLSLIDAKEKIAIDPLINKYKEIGVWSYDGKYLVEDGKRVPLPDNYADVVFSLNTLDHCFKPENSARVASEYKRLLKTGGRLYIHVHLRTGDQLNVYHLYGVEEKELNEWFGDMKKIMWEIDDECIVWERPYRTFWGILEK